jgi:hypothetical protein
MNVPTGHKVGKIEFKGQKPPGEQMFGLLVLKSGQK